MISAQLIIALLPKELQHRIDKKEPHIVPFDQVM